jgi:hypothetical protein
VQPGCPRARELPKGQFKQEVEKELTGRETEPYELLALLEPHLHVAERTYNSFGWRSFAMREIEALRGQRGQWGTG